MGFFAGNEQQAGAPQPVPQPAGRGGPLRHRLLAAMPSFVIDRGLGLAGAIGPAQRNHAARALFFRRVPGLASGPGRPAGGRGVALHDLPGLVFPLLPGHLGRPLAGRDVRAVSPPARQGGLRGGREPHPVLRLDPLARADVDQPGAGPGHREEIGNVIAGPVSAGEGQPERLGQHLNQFACEIQRQQQLLLSVTFEPVMTARAHHVLQPRPVELRRTPGKPPDRLSTPHRHRRQITDRTDHRPPIELPARRPPTGPFRPEHQRSPALRQDAAARRKQLFPPAPIRGQLTQPGALRQRGP